MSIRDELARDIATSLEYADSVAGIVHATNLKRVDILGEFDLLGAAESLIADRWTKQAPCVMTHTPPYDFAQCETHDETFPLGENCRFHDRDMVEVLFEAADEQRGRAVRAELYLERVRAIADELLADIPYDTDNEHARFIGQKLLDAIGGKQ